MKVEFGELTLENFKSWRGVHTINLTPSPGLFYLKGQNKTEPRLGANGCGKSSVWDALTWVLYGTTGEGLRNVDVRTWGSKHRPAVELTIAGGSLRRTPGYLTFDDKIIGPHQVREIVGMSRDLFLNTLLYGQGLPLFFDLQGRYKMDLLSDAMSLSKWDDWAKNASTRARRFDSTLRELEKEQAAVSAELETLKRTKNKIRKQSREWDEENSKGVGELENTIKNLSDQFEILADEEAVVDLEHESLELELTYVDAQIKKLEEALWEDKHKKTKVDEARGLIKKYRDDLSSLNDACPTCGQHLSDKIKKQSKARLIKQIARSRAVISKNKSSEYDDTQLKQERQHRTKLEDKIRKVSTKKINKQVELQKVKNELTGARLQLDKKDTNKNPFTQQLLDIRRQERSARIKQKKAEERISKLHRMIERARFWSRGFKDVRIYALEELLIELEMNTNAGLEDIGLVGWSVRYEMEKESKKGTVKPQLDIIISSPGQEDGVKWQCWSGGERQRLRLVGALALSETLLNHVGLDINLEVLDEPTRSLSKQGVDDLCEYLSQRSLELDRTTWYVDHNAIESSKFVDTLTVQMTEGGSTFC